MIARHRIVTALGLTGCLAASIAAQDSLAARPRPTAPVVSANGMVGCSSGIACDAGASVLAKGGNAVDAAVATAFAMAVTYPAAGNIGGGGFMMVRSRRGVTSFDFRERAPLASTPTMYLDTAQSIDRRLTATGYLAPGVPGTVRGLEMAHRKHGRMPWPDVVAPAIELAERGFALSDALARSLNREVARGMAPYPASVAAYGKPGGGEWSPGDTIRLPDLARSLKAIASGGADAFYTGWIADSIAADMARSNGLITKRDLAEYRAKERKPIKGSFRGYDVYSMPPPSSGGIALVQMLNVLDEMKLGAEDRWSPHSLHVTIEAMRRAYHDRAQHLGDPDFVKVPVKHLTSRKYAKELAAAMNTDTATSSLMLTPRLVTTIADDESDETTHISVVDRDGMAVSMTYTLEGGFGSHVVMRGTGILLNNEMGDFNKKPGYTSLTGDIGTPPNVIAPGKRMLSSMTPTIVLKGGDVLITGSPGGRTIINTVLNVLIGSLAYNMDVRAAVDAPRLHHQWLPDSVTFEDNAIPDSTAARLRAMGHGVRVRGQQGDAHTIRFDPRTRTSYGANDARSADSKVSVP